MRYLPTALLAAAGVLWGSAIGADADDVKARILLPLLAGACVLTTTGINQLCTRKALATYDALTQAILARPLLRSDTGPIPAVTELRPGDLERAAERPSGRGTRRARHATH
jgi:hypothetical protein